MGKKFQFSNRDYCQSFLRKKQPSFPIQKIFLLPIVFSAFAGLLSLKVFKPFTEGRMSSPAPSSKSDQKKLSYTLPLLVNLKGPEGPRLARIHVDLTFSGDQQKEAVFQNKQLEKQVLFLLSGQDVQDLSKKKNYFEKEIRSQLNVFLSQEAVDGVQIKTDMIN